MGITPVFLKNRFQNHIRLSLIKYQKKNVRMYKHAYSDRYFLGRSLDFRIQDEKVRTCICDSLHTYMCNAIKQLL